MPELEKPYIQALVRYFKPTGDVLEIGFWQDSAREVKKYHPKSHTIIEQDPHRVKKSTGFSVIVGSWPSTLKTLEAFDEIILNGYPPALAPKHTLPLTEFHKAKTLLEEEKKLAKMVEDTLPHLTSIRYSDEDLDSFFTEVNVEMKNELIYFLEALKKNGQISESQHQQYLEKQGLLAPQYTLHSFWLNPSQFLQFLIPCLKNHLRKGGRFCCYIDPTSSKYDDPEFFNTLITNPQFEYEEKSIMVGSSEALLMAIKKS